jgi:tRNA(fMet)-specific endonuclease VapC
MTDAVLLDTNAVIALFKNEPGIQEHIRKSSKVFVPNVVLGELYFGAFKSTFIEKNLERITQLGQFCEILYSDKETSRIYGQWKSKLESKGKPIPDNDLWIASLALQHQLTVITKDLHFSEFQELPILKW